MPPSRFRERERELSGTAILDEILSQQEARRSRVVPGGNVKKIFEVKETFHGYRLVHLATGLSRCLGDGVADFLDGEHILDVGTGLFREQWEREANECVHVYFEAYFPRLDGLEIYDNEGEYVDRYTAITEHASPLECSLQACEDLYVCLGLPEDCDRLDGFSQWGFVVLPNEMIGERVHFLELPENVQRHLAERLEGGRDE